MSCFRQIGVASSMIWLGLAATAARAGGPFPPEVDGARDGTLTDAFLVAVQNGQTSFGDNMVLAPDVANGSELDLLVGDIIGDTLHLFIGGNLELNFNDVELFLDTRPGGQNRLVGNNPDVDFDGLNRMGDDGSGNGLTFDAGFEADFWLHATAEGGFLNRLYANYAELEPGGTNGAFLGWRGVGTFGGDGQLMGGTNPFDIRVALNNFNVVGVTAGTGWANGFGAEYGLEWRIPLAAIGNPTGPIKVCVILNGGAHDFMSNQVLPPVNARDSLGDPRSVNFASIPGLQYAYVRHCGALPGDTNLDGLINGDDVPGFVESFINHPDAATLCASDLNLSGLHDPDADMSLFLSVLLNPPVQVAFPRDQLQALSNGVTQLLPEFTGQLDAPHFVLFESLDPRLSARPVSAAIPCGATPVAQPIAVEANVPGTSPVVIPLLVHIFGPFFNGVLVVQLQINPAAPAPPNTTCAVGYTRVCDYSNLVAAESQCALAGGTWNAATSECTVIGKWVSVSKFCKTAPPADAVVPVGSDAYRVDESGFVPTMTTFKCASLCEDESTLCHGVRTATAGGLCIDCLCN
ncbi:MAG: hypothetical protein U1A27_07205 [Phycisphaerae bacterium]